MRVLELLENEITTSMGLLGVTRIDELTSAYLCPVQPPGPDPRNERLCPYARWPASVAAPLRLSAPGHFLAPSRFLSLSGFDHGSNVTLDRCMIACLIFSTLDLAKS
jgi:hypothetical protein